MENGKQESLLFITGYLMRICFKGTLNFLEVLDVNYDPMRPSNGYVKRLATRRGST
jgi:hypothetical protein